VPNGKAKGGGCFQERTEFEPRMQPGGAAVDVDDPFDWRQLGATHPWGDCQLPRPASESPKPIMREAPPGFTKSRAVPSHHVSNPGMTRSGHEVVGASCHDSSKSRPAPPGAGIRWSRGAVRGLASGSKTSRSPPLVLPVGSGLSTPDLSRCHDPCRGGAIGPLAK